MCAEPRSPAAHAPPDNNPDAAMHPSNAPKACTTHVEATPPTRRTLAPKANINRQPRAALARTQPKNAWRPDKPLAAPAAAATKEAQDCHLQLLPAAEPPAVNGCRIPPVGEPQKCCGLTWGTRTYPAGSNAAAGSASMSASSRGDFVLTAALGLQLTQVATTARGYRVPWAGRVCSSHTPQDSHPHQHHHPPSASPAERRLTLIPSGSLSKPNCL